MGAPRLLSRIWRPCARGAVLASVLVAALAGAQAVAGIQDARFDGPTTRYSHGVLGDEIEHDVLEIRRVSGGIVRITLPDVLVFEDVAPRVVDVTGDGVPEVVVVESHQHNGARLAIYNETGRIAATPYIGKRFRWLAPVGIAAADLDGDGAIELAYVDRPHLAKTLRVWRFAKGRLIEVAQLAGVTNHRIGERDIAGGIRTCNGVPEMIVADAQWQSILAVALRDGALSARRIARHRGRASFERVMRCE